MQQDYSPFPLLVFFAALSFLGALYSVFMSSLGLSQAFQNTATVSWRFLFAVLVFANVSVQVLIVMVLKRAYKRVSRGVLGWFFVLFTPTFLLMVLAVMVGLSWGQGLG